MLSKANGDRDYMFSLLFLDLIHRTSVPDFALDELIM